MKQGGELIRLLYGEKAAPPNERLQKWAEAFEAWLEERRTKFSRNVGPDSHRAWAEFLAMTRKAPWEVGTAEWEVWQVLDWTRRVWKPALLRPLTGQVMYRTSGPSSRKNTGIPTTLSPAGLRE